MNVICEDSPINSVFSTVWKAKIKSFSKELSKYLLYWKIYYKSIACRCQHSAVGRLTEDKNCKSKKGHNSEKKKCIQSCLLWLYGLDSEHVFWLSKKSIFSNNINITQCQSFCTMPTMTMTTPMKTPRLLQYFRFSPKTTQATKCPSLIHYHTMPHFDALKIYSYGKHCKKRRNGL